MTRFLPLLSALVVVLPASTPLASRAVEGSSCERALRQATAQLQRAWQQDPLTARRPFPAIRLVDGASGPLVRVCPSSSAGTSGNAGRRDRLRPQRRWRRVGALARGWSTAWLEVEAPARVRGRRSPVTRACPVDHGAISVVRLLRMGVVAPSPAKGQAAAGLGGQPGLRGQGGNQGGWGWKRGAALSLARRGPGWSKLFSASCSRRRARGACHPAHALDLVSVLKGHGHL